MHLADVLLGLAARKHDLMTAALTTELKVHADAFNLPFITAAGMRLLHFYDITELNVHLPTSDRLPGMTAGGCFSYHTKNGR